MKKILSVLLAFAMLFASFTAFAGEEPSAEPSAPDAVEICLTIGDGVILINGAEVETEAPCISDNGTALVPLRVIAEAFGASVSWEDGEILIEYPDVTVTLRIGSTEASVNTHKEALPAPPALTESGVAMVPLRFMAETFGAELSYGEDGTVTVSKSEQDESQTILGTMNDKDRVGDSLCGWSMNTPKDLMMEDRDADGTYTEFADEDYNYLDINIYETDENTSFEYDFAEKKESFRSRSALICAEKSTDEYNNPTMHFKARNTDYYYELFCVYTDDYVFSLNCSAEYGSSAAASISALISSFKADFGDENITYDLAPKKTEDGNILHEDEDLSLKFSMPSYMTKYESYYYSPFGFLSFYSSRDDDNTAFNLSIYSKTDTLSAQSAAEAWRKVCTDYFSREVISVSDTEPYSVLSGENGRHYTVSSIDRTYSDLYFDDIYFEKGSYIYNLTFYCSPEDLGGDGKDIVSSVMDSLECEELDESEIGVIVMNTYETGSSYTLSGKTWSLSVPLMWSKLQNYTAENADLHHRFTNAHIYLSTEENADISSLKKYAEEELRFYLIDSEVDLIRGVCNTLCGNNAFYTFTYGYKNKYSDSYNYITRAYILKNKTLYTISYERSAEYGNKLDEEFESMLSSFTPIKQRS